jgi:hypothetical protein
MCFERSTKQCGVQEGRKEDEKDEAEETKFAFGGDTRRDEAKKRRRQKRKKELLYQLN